MKLKEALKVIEHIEIAKDTFIIQLKGEEIVQEITNPGQFLQVSVKEKFLPRPISICDFSKERGTITLIYKTIGEGTKLLSQDAVGEMVTCFGPLGNGFELDTMKDVDHVTLVGGGIGVPPMYSVAKELKAKYPEKKITSVLGFLDQESSFYEEQFLEFGDVITKLDNASNEKKGNVIDGMKQIDVEFICSCGPTGMLKAISSNYPDTPGMYSLEERMACGYGVCMGCLSSKGKRLCLEGPVVQKEEF